jgi:hypothetical protein
MFRLTGSPGEEIGFSIGKEKGVNVSFRYKSAMDGITPWYQFRVFVFGTYLGRNPYQCRRCCSNGIALISISAGRE